MKSWGSFCWNDDQFHKEGSIKLIEIGKELSNYTKINVCYQNGNSKGYLSTKLISIKDAKYNEHRDVVLFVYCDIRELIYRIETDGGYEFNPHFDI